MAFGNSGHAFGRAFRKSKKRIDLRCGNDTLGNVAPRSDELNFSTCLCPHTLYPGPELTQCVVLGDEKGCPREWF